MSGPILATKLYIPPPRPELVPRPHLIEHLNQGLHRKLTLISAPAGFGKTTLVAAWLSNFRFTMSDFGLNSVKEKQIQNPQFKIGNRVAWLSLDEADNDPVRFLTYLMAALQSVKPGLANDITQTLRSPQPPPTDTLLTTLVNELAAIDDPFVVVLDDYHLVESPDVDRMLSFLLDHQPPQMHLVISGRADPSLPLSRLRARGQMNELRMNDLRFNAAEISAFLKQVTAIDFNPDDVTTLETRTEGWAAGLQLAALAMQAPLAQKTPLYEQDASNIERFMSGFSGSHRYIIDYLADEVLLQQPQPIQDFLLQTSILDRLCGPLCDAVTGQSNGQQTLESLEAANLFLIPLDNERRWYRYHHLFADLLRQRLHQNPPPVDDSNGKKQEKANADSAIAKLHHRASLWYSQQAATVAEAGLLSAALKHTLAAQDLPQATYLVENYAGEKLKNGEISTVMAWLNALPTGTIEASPILCIMQAWVLYFTQNSDEIEKYLDAAEQIIQANEKTTDGYYADCLGDIYHFRAWLTQNQGDYKQARQLYQQALELLPEENLLARGLSAIFMAGILHQLGDIPQAVQTYVQGIAICQAAGNTLAVTGAANLLTILYMALGQPQKAATMLRKILHWAAEHNLQQSPALADLYLGLSLVLYEQNQLDAVENYLRAGLEASEKGLTVTELPKLAYLNLARLKLARKDSKGARRAMQQADKQADRGQRMPQGNIYTTCLRVRLALQLNDLAMPLRWQKTVDPATEGQTLAREFERLTLARVLMAQANSAQLPKAIQLLEHLRQNARTTGKNGQIIEASLLLARAYDIQHNQPKSLAALEQALTLAEPEGYIRTFVDEGPPIAELLAKIKCDSKGITNYITKLLALFDTDDTPPSSPTPQPLVEPLSERELDVLRLLPSDLSTPEIAEELMVAPSTVRSHIKNIYGKLNAHSRYEAIQRARELNILKG